MLCALYNFQHDEVFNDTGTLVRMSADSRSYSHYRLDHTSDGTGVGNIPNAFEEVQVVHTFVVGYASEDSEGTWFVIVD